MILYLFFKLYVDACFKKFLFVLSEATIEADGGPVVLLWASIVAHVAEAEEAT